MLQIKRFAAAPALVLLMGGTAHAALTVDQVWQSWKDGAALAGLEITAATESNSGGVMKLNGVLIAPAGQTVGVTISDITLTEQDGTVVIAPGADIGLDANEDSTKVKFDLDHDGLNIVAKEGANGGVVYDYTAAKLSLGYDVSVPGYSYDESVKAEPSEMDGKIDFDTLTGTYSDTPGTNRAFGLSLAAAKMLYEINQKDPAMSSESTSTSETVDVTFALNVALPSTIALTEAFNSPQGFGTALQEGFAVTLASEQGASNGKMSEKSEFMPYDLTLTAQPSKGDVEFNKDRFSANSTSDGFTIDATSPMMPAPAKISSGPLVFGMLSPVQSGETAGDYALKMKLDQLTINDELWGLLDGAANLKREPIDLDIDLSGKAKVDWVAMAIADTTGGPEVVPQPESLDINQVALKLAGAALQATGAFTFDNSMGMPAPLGEANISVTGANQLIDGLIATGLLSEDDAMGARMMMGMFMMPGSEPDSLTSKIEAKEGFQIFVNGQQIQ